MVQSRFEREKYRHGYQGAFSEEDTELGWNSFELRLYDPIIARWLSTDPNDLYASPYLAMGMGWPFKSCEGIKKPPRHVLREGF
jgi:RHS repeat-associated protein